MTTLGQIVREALMTRPKHCKPTMRYMTYEKMRSFSGLPVSKRAAHEKLVMYEPVTDPIVNIPSLWPGEKMDCLGRTVSFLEIGQLAFRAYQIAKRLGRTVQNMPVMLPQTQNS